MEEREKKKLRGSGKEDRKDLGGLLIIFVIWCIMYEDDEQKKRGSQFEEGKKKSIKKALSEGTKNERRPPVIIHFKTGALWWENRTVFSL